MNSLLEVHTFCHAAELGFSKSLQAYEDRQLLYSGILTPTKTGARRPHTASTQTLGQEGLIVQAANTGARRPDTASDKHWGKKA